MRRKKKEEAVRVAKEPVADKPVKRAARKAEEPVAATSETYEFDRQCLAEYLEITAKVNAD